MIDISQSPRAATNTSNFRLNSIELLSNHRLWLRIGDEQTQKAPRNANLLQRYCSVRFLPPATRFYELDSEIFIEKNLIKVIISRKVRTVCVQEKLIFTLAGLKSIHEGRGIEPPITHILRPRGNGCR